MAETKKQKSIAKPTAKPGPKAATLKIKGNWRGAIRQSLAKRKPPEGWPK